MPTPAASASERNNRVPVEYFYPVGQTGEPRPAGGDAWARLLETSAGMVASTPVYLGRLVMDTPDAGQLFGDLREAADGVLVYEGIQPPELGGRLTLDDRGRPAAVEMRMGEQAPTMTITRWDELPFAPPYARPKAR